MDVGDVFGRSEPVYEGPLTEFIGAALTEDGMDRVVAAAEDGETVEDLPVEEEALPYIEKILEEEVEKQFTDPQRPFIELVLNAIDARPDDAGEYTVDIRTSPWSFTVSDRGTAMELDELLENFIIPFSSDKDEYSDIGRFGVGFYANLSKCLADDSEITIDTATADEAYRMEFWSETDSVDGLNIRLEPGSRSGQGTEVRMTGLSLGSDFRDLHDYIGNYLEYFDPDRARVRDWWMPLNVRPEGETRRHTATFDIEGREVEQEIRYTLDTEGTEDTGIQMYSQGVLIQEYGARAGAFHLSLPPAVTIVEGRDAFKRDHVYEQAMDEVYGMLVDHVEEMEDPDDSLRELLPHIESYAEHELDVGLKERLADVLFPSRPYVVSCRSMGVWDERDEVERFFGPSTPGLYGAPDGYARSFWGDVLPGKEDLLEERTEVLDAGRGADVRRYLEANGEGTANTDVLSDVQRYRLVDVDGEPGLSPFISADGCLYVRHDHPYFRTENTAARLGVLTSHVKARGEAEGYVEKRVLMP